MIDFPRPDDPFLPGTSSDQLAPLYQRSGVWRHKWADRTWVERVSPGESATDGPLFVAADEDLAVGAQERRDLRDDLLVARVDGRLHGRAPDVQVAARLGRGGDAQDGADRLAVDEDDALVARGDLRQDLLTVGNGIVETLARSPAGAVISALAADLIRHPDMAEQFRNQVIRPRRSDVTQILRRAIDRGELPVDLDAELLLDVYAGAIFYRVLVSGEPVTDLLVEQLVSLLLDGKAPVRPSAAR